MQRYNCNEGFLQLVGCKQKDAIRKQRSMTSFQINIYSYNKYSELRKRGPKATLDFQREVWNQIILCRWSHVA